MNKIIILNRLKASLVDVTLILLAVLTLKTIGVNNAIGIVPIYYFLMFYVRSTTIGGVLFKVRTKSLNSEQGFKIYGIVIKVFIVSNFIFYAEKVIPDNVIGLLVAVSVIVANYLTSLFTKKGLTILDYLSFSQVIEAKSNKLSD